MSEALPDENMQGAERWAAPTIDGSDSPGFMTAENLEKLQKEAWDEAYAEGLEAGKAAGGEQVRLQAERLQTLGDALAEPLADVDDTVAEQLVELAISALRQLFRREINTEPEHVIGVVREAIQLLPIASRNVRVFLHPDDARLVAETLSQAEGECAWSVCEDPLLTRGGCRVSTDNSRIDATAEARLQAAISSLLGDSRSAKEPSATDETEAVAPEEPPAVDDSA